LRNLVLTNVVGRRETKEVWWHLQLNQIISRNSRTIQCYGESKSATLVQNCIPFYRTLIRCIDPLP